MPKTTVNLHTMRSCSSNKLKPNCSVVGSTSGAPTYRRIAVLIPVSLLNVDPRIYGTALIPARDSSQPSSMSQVTLTIVANTPVSINDNGDSLPSPNRNHINGFARFSPSAVRFDHSHGMTIDREIKACRTCYVDYSETIS